MKRLVIVIAVIAGIVGVCIFSIYEVRQVRDQVETYSNAVFAALEGKGELVERVRQLTEYWQGEEHILVRFVRHGQVDEITKSMAKLEPLAQYDAHHELAAELHTILWQMEHIWQSERLTLGNIL